MVKLALDSVWLDLGREIIVIQLGSLMPLY